MMYTIVGVVPDVFRGSGLQRLYKYPFNRNRYWSNRYWSYTPSDILGKPEG